jgi:hypothetical protein
MDKKNENSYNIKYPIKKDNLRSEIAFQNMLIHPNNLFPIGPMPNIVFVDTNFLNKKREVQDLSTCDILGTGEKSKCKYYFKLLLYFFYEIFVEFISKNISRNKKI